MKKLIVTIFLVVVSSSVLAGEQTVTLSLPSMNCATCPITVTKALEKVDGVTRADVDYESKSAVVTFDDEKTTVQSLMEATRNAGFPSSIKG